MKTAAACLCSLAVSLCPVAVSAQSTSPDMDTATRALVAEMTTVFEELDFADSLKFGFDDIIASEIEITCKRYAKHVFAGLNWLRQAQDAGIPYGNILRLETPLPAVEPFILADPALIADDPTMTVQLSVSTAVNDICHATSADVLAKAKAG